MIKKMERKQKIILGIFFFLAVSMIYFVSSATPLIICSISPDGTTCSSAEESSNGITISSTITSLESQTIKPEKSQEQKDCNQLKFCWSDKDQRCYSMGARITIEPEYKNRKFSWRNESYLYCEQGEYKFVYQKITGEICKNDFECQSNRCNDKKCEQKEGIKITETYNDRETIVRNLFFRENETFYFSGLNKNYSVGFSENNSDFVFFINNNSTSLKNKTLTLNNNSKFIINSISFDNGVANANVTLAESKRSFNDISELFLPIINEEKNENNISVEIQKKEDTVKITGNVIKTEEENYKKGLFEKIINWFSKLF
ncbi:hypothetical protein HY449_01095 [Candidatus Pacearchaeota archaeon]|nr:hypothetical protein [Candidatus Pacearchaeota archaeon]